MRGFANYKKTIASKCREISRCYTPEDIQLPFQFRNMSIHHVNEVYYETDLREMAKLSLKYTQSKQRRIYMYIGSCPAIAQPSP